MRPRHWQSFGYPALLAILFGWAYLRTLSPTIWYGDTAEFQTIAVMGGLGHPTGYPLYLTIAKLFVHLPFGNPAANLNFMSALFGVLAVLIVYLLGRQVIDSRAAAFGAALIFGIGKSFWSQTSLAEVYTLHIFLLGLVLLLFLRWARESLPVFLWCGLFVLGLSFGNHMSTVLVIPALIYLIIIHRKALLVSEKKSSAFTLFIPLGAALGIVLLLYYLLDRSASQYDHLRAIDMMSPESWGKTAADFDSFPKRILHLLTARQFAGSMFNIGWDEMGRRAIKSLAFARENLGYPGIAAAIVGTVVLFIKRIWLAIFWGIFGLSVYIYCLNYGIWEFDIDIYFIPIWLAAAVIVGLLFEYIHDRVSGFLLGKYLNPLVGAVVLVAIVFSILAGSEQGDGLKKGHPPGIPEPRAAYQSAKPVVDKLEDNAIVFALWHQIHVLGYIFLIEEKRSGIGLHEIYPAGQSYKFSTSYLKYIDANIDSRPIYLTYPARGLDTLYRFEDHPPLIRLRRK